MAAAGEILDGMRQVQATTERVMGRFESSRGTLSQGQQTADAFVTHGSQVLSGMITAGQEQTALLQQLKNAQGEMESAMREYAEWSGRVLTAVKEQADGALSAAGNVSAGMDESSRKLADTYARFVDDLSAAFSRGLGMFDENITSMIKALQEQLEEMKTLSGGAGAAARLEKEAQGCVSAISQLQRAVTGLSAAMEQKPAEAAS